MNNEEHDRNRYKRGCRCEKCHIAELTYRRALRSKRRSGVAPRELVHSISGYNRGCRCDVCKAGKRESLRAWRAANPEKRRDQYDRANDRRAEVTEVALVTTSDIAVQWDCIKEMPKLNFTGACKGADTNLWFSFEVAEVLAAKRICKECPARIQCLEYALAAREDYGVFGGLTERERRREIRKRQRNARKALAVAS